ncbi:MAG: DUF1257 domain-containing protein [Rhodopirellula sp.]|nr:DUF1257 domain-containing protein [Rhodopirellula sp.]
MSSVVVVAPIIIANWPAITAAVTAAVATMGFAVARQGAEEHQAATTREEIEVEDSEILEAAAGTDRELVVERDGLRAVFRRDARGALRVCMEGNGYSKAQMRQIGQDLIDRVTQQYVYHRVVTELKNRKMNIVDEEVTEDRTVKIRVRNW